MEDMEMYEGFTKDEVKSMRKEVKERWGEAELVQTEQNIKLMGKDSWNEHKKEGERITILLADLMETCDPADKEVQIAVADWHQYLTGFYEVSEERMLGLGQMYV